MRSSRILAARELAVIRAAKWLYRLRRNIMEPIDGARVHKAQRNLDRAVNMLTEYERKHKP